ncbi:hypothetical protein [Streptomyces sp. NPDC002671]
MSWRGTRSEIRALEALNQQLALLGERLHVVLGDHENYDVIDTLSRNGSGVLWMGSHLALLPRSGLVRAGQHPVGWLSGAASIDRCVRMPSLTWWEAELPTDEQAAGPLDAGASPDVVLAHEALAVPGLIQRLGDGRGWHPDDLAYARAVQQVHTARVLSALDPAKETLCVAGHCHFRHS